MRTKPGPASKLLPSAHAIEREFRVMHALAGSDVPVPRMHLLCEDESVIGRAFYVMEFVQGRVLWDQSLPGMTREQRGAIYDEMNRVIAALHKLDVGALGLSDFGRPGNYFERQIARWSKQYQASITGANEAMDRLIEWLPTHIPTSARDESMVSVVHGDFRLDNLIFHPTEPRVLAVLDWELSTIGHPLADFSYHCMSWHIPPGTFSGIGGLDHAALGIPLEADYVRRYCERSGRGTPASPEGRLELLPGLQPVSHRGHRAGHRQARRSRHGGQRTGAPVRGRCHAPGRTGLALRAGRLSGPRLRRTVSPAVAQVRWPRRAGSMPGTCSAGCSGWPGRRRRSPRAALPAARTRTGAPRLPYG